MEMQEQQMWKQGLYFKEALQSTILVCGLADKKVIGKMPKYPEMPKSQDDIDKEAHIEAQRQIFIAKMNKWQKINNAKNRK